MSWERGVWVVCLMLLACCPLLGAEPRLTPDDARHYYLDDLILTHDYVPGKNSFVLQDFNRGDSKTLLDLQGSGSIRHIWATWAASTKRAESQGPDKVILTVFVDGEKKPSLAGPIDEICLAAETSGAAYAPQPAFNFKRSFNLYLPIYFARGIRIEAQASGEFRQFYAQLDYRLTKRAERRARLISRRTAQGLELSYVGDDAPQYRQRASSPQTTSTESWQTVLSAAGGSATYQLDGPAIVRELTVQGSDLDDIAMSIAWDDEADPSVAAPLRYLFGGFETLVLESRAAARSCYFPMPFLKRARITLRNSAQSERAVGLRLVLDRTTAVPAAPYYFHARFQEIDPSLGYRDFPVVTTRGEGHFVGVTLFDTGHDHGGGDTALLDADTSSPHVLHGICGEDYFSFAWFGTDRMQFLAGAPEQSRRYRFHLENPYPFHSSMMFTFGVFAGMHPKSVGFWYQRPAPPVSDRWLTPNVTWNVFGPVGMDQEMPDEVTGQEIESALPVVKTERFRAGWAGANMAQGFLDLSHHYRHYIMLREGTGFIAGKCRVRAVTFIHASREVDVDAIAGHDDAIAVSVNGTTPVKLGAHAGFHASRIKLHLRHGWNKVAVSLDNDENVNWRWLGFSLALRADPGALRELRFSAAPNERMK